MCGAARKLSQGSVLQGPEVLKNLRLGFYFSVWLSEVSKLSQRHSWQEAEPRLNSGCLMPAPPMGTTLWVRISLWMLE